MAPTLRRRGPDPERDGWEDPGLRAYALRIRAYPMYQVVRWAHMEAARRKRQQFKDGLLLVAFLGLYLGVLVIHQRLTGRALSWPTAIAFWTSQHLLHRWITGQRWWQYPPVPPPSTAVRPGDVSRA